MNPAKKQIGFGIACLAGALLAQEFSLRFGIKAAGITLPELYSFAWKQALLVGDLTSLWLAVHAFLHFSGRRPGRLWNRSGAYIFFQLAFGTALLLATNPVLAGRFMVFRALAALVLIFLLLKWLYIAVVPKENAEKGRPARGGLLVFAILLCFFLGEIVFMFVPSSHVTIESLSSRIWMQRYWEVNSHGYRDTEWETRKDSRVLLIGDSFTAGHGVKDPEDRFGNILDREFGDRVDFLNLGTLGYGPELELENLEWYDGEASGMVYIWYLNDIHDPAKARLPEFAQFLDEKPKRTRTLNPVKCSYLINFIYWSFPHQSAEFNYVEHLKTAYSDPEILREHFDAIDQLLESAEKREMKVAVVLFPNLMDVKGSNFAIEPVLKHLREKRISTLDLRALLTGYSPQELIVNKNDAHPNVRCNQLVADTLLPFLAEEWNFVD